MKRIVINGANGYVASNFINELLNKDYEVIALVRNSKKCPSEERMHNVLSDLNNGMVNNLNRLKVHSYSLLDKDFAIRQEVLTDIFSTKVDYYHFAASLKYDLKSKEEIFTTNLSGLENSMKVFLKYANQDSRFFFISTAYSCGKFNGMFEEKFYENQDIDQFRNYYEQSKRFAENTVKQYIDNHQLNAHIIRLSQVIGNNETGITKTDYGIFDFARRVKSLAKRHPNNTVRIKVDAEATQNLIPIDTITNYLQRTIEINTLPIIMNFVAKQSTKNAHIINAINQLVPILITPKKQFDRSEMNSLERIIDIGMSFTGSYTSTNLSFSTSNLDSILKNKGGEASKESIFNMLQYFLSDDEKKKTPAPQLTEA